MGIVVHQSLITPETAQALQKVCPFGAIDYDGEKLQINAACKSCKLCVKKGPAGALTWEADAPVSKIDKSAWRGIAVYAQCQEDGLHPVTPELIGKARELAAVIHEEVLAILIGSQVNQQANELLAYGVDRVYVYDDPAFADLTITPYANAFYDFIDRVHPGSILVGATNWGRSLAPKVAARCGAGLTADCTRLEMKENTDLVQIRPAFGGNIMAQIVSPEARPQFCTVRYKIFSAPSRMENPTGTVIKLTISPEKMQGHTEIIAKKAKPKLIDISEAEVVVACGRGVRSQADLAMAEELSTLLNEQLACTRPLV